MDWNLKAPWDFTELDEATLPSIGTGMVNGSITRYGINKTEGEFSVDLKLGQVGTSRNESPQNWKETGVSKVASSPSGSSKRARAVNNGTQTVACLVDGCNSDLSNCRDYHRRHKVCEIHSKTPQVTICGQKQRFCQQCSRFHSLDEFDEGKRSCRKRLDGHNRRRRKPQPEPITRPATFLSSYQGSQLLPLATSHVYPSTAVVSPSWSTGVVTTSGSDARLQNQHQQLHLIGKHNQFMRSSRAGYKESKQYTFLQEENSSLCNQTGARLQASLSQSLIRTHTNLSESGDQFRQKMFCDDLTSQAQNSRSCALSLLSSPQTQTNDNGLNQMVQPLGLSLQDSHFESVDSVLVSNANGGDTNLHGTGMYTMGSDESQGNEAAPQPFHFAWD